jgi:enoyl-CoA hydratase/carnithine racemase
MRRVTYEKRNKVMLISLNRPEKLNAIDEAMARDMSEVWKEFKKDDDVWTAILSGAGEHFCAGLDLSSGPPTGSLTEWLLPFLPSFHEVWKPVVAAVNGHCIGGGWMIAQDCDLRICSEDAQFSVPEARVNMVTLFSGFFHRYLPPGLALETLLTGEGIDSKRAYDIGFVNHVVKKDSLIDAAFALAEKINRNGPMAVRKMKELFYRGMDLPIEEAKAFTHHLFTENLRSEDTQEGIRAFVEKRTPKYSGR